MTCRLAHTLTAGIATGFLCVALAACGGGGSSSGGGGGGQSSTTTSWAWIDGSTTIMQDTVAGPPDVNAVPFVTAPAHGTTGVMAVNQPQSVNGSSLPGARAGAATWTDSQGNSYLFGGVGFDSTGASGELNDLWNYTAASGKWSLVSGSSAVGHAGIYGTRGSADPANSPGSRDGAATFIDSNHVLWLFGGNGFDSQGNVGWLNDLWKYDPSAGAWTWIGGSDLIDTPGSYGTKGSGGAGNIPGSRAAAVAWVNSKTGDFWLFGGVGLDSAGSVDELNDLWKYSGGQWTWVSGSDTVDASGVYSGSAAVPGARAGATGVAASGKLWLLTGGGFDSEGTFGALNDAWTYDMSKGQWRWVSGSQTANQAGVYGTLGQSGKSNIPGGRGGAVSMIDKSGRIWLTGGGGLDSNGGIGLLNDEWMYQPNSQKWTWTGGSTTIDQPGQYGTQGVSSKNNAPGGRVGASMLADGSGNARLFGGIGFDTNGSLGYLNDFWNQ